MPAPRKSTRRPPAPKKAAPSDPRRAASLAILYGELAMAQADGDADGVKLAQRAIDLVLSPQSDEPLDEPMVLPVKTARSPRRVRGKVA